MRSALFKALFYVISALMLALTFLPALFSDAAARGGFALWARIIGHLLRLVLNVRVTVRGGEHLPTGPALIAAKHQSIAETVLLFAVIPKLAPVLKKELLRIPGAPLFAVRLGAVPIDRGGGRAQLAKMCDAARRVFMRGGQILIFPEGTRRNVGDKPRYARGVAGLYAELRTPCIPLAINSGVFWPKSGPMRANGNMVFEFLPPIPRDLPPEVFMQRLQHDLEQASDRLAEEA